MASNPKILFVDDDPDLRCVVMDELLSCGFIVDEAETIRQATDKLKLNGYDVVLLDLQLPDGSGTNVLRFISANEITCKVIMLTGACALDAAETIKCGATDYVCKPFELENLVGSIRRALDQEEIPVS